MGRPQMARGWPVTGPAGESNVFVILQPELKFPLGIKMQGTQWSHQQAVSIDNELGTQGSYKKSGKGACVDCTLGGTVHYCCWVEPLMQEGPVSGTEQNVVPSGEMFWQAI